MIRLCYTISLIFAIVGLLTGTVILLALATCLNALLGVLNT